MNYRHAFHAGNFADVVKHLVLVLVLAHLRLKPAPFFVLDTHAGAGFYDLDSTEAEKTGEWREGIGRVIAPAAATPLDPIAIAPLAPYLDAVRSFNPADALTAYPGSPSLITKLLRQQDRATFVELHHEDHGRLAETFAGDRRIRVRDTDGWGALKSELPPRERRGLVLIDPPYESKGELETVVRGLGEALKRFATGTYLIWYPIKLATPVDSFFSEASALRPGKILRAELLVRRSDAALALNGCGLLIVNPSWTLAEQLRIVFPGLAERLQRGAGFGWRVDNLSA